MGPWGGYAYFPGLSTVNGPESLLFDKIPACNSGPHTVRVNYLVSQGQDRNLELTSREGEGEGGALRRRSVTFPTPAGFDAFDRHTWAKTPPVVMDFKHGESPDLTLSGGAVVVDPSARVASREGEGDDVDEIVERPSTELVDGETFDGADDGKNEDAFDEELSEELDEAAGPALHSHLRGPPQAPN